MRLLSPSALGVVAAAAFLAGCNSSGGSQWSGPTLSSGANAGTSSHDVNPLTRDTRHASDMFAGVKWTGNVHPDHHKSWVSPDAQRAPRLLFVSDIGTGDVYIFTMPDMKLKGTLTGFADPQGECSDTHGNIYVANTSEADLFEYSRTGKLLNTYDTDKYGYPLGCAVNPLNGDLAITDYVGLSEGPGQVLIYSSASSTPTVLTNPNQYYYYFADYDAKGDLWVDGDDATGGYILSDCGTSSCSTITLTGGKINVPGAVQWDQKENTWVLFDQRCGGKYAACSYLVSGSGVIGQATSYKNSNGTAICDLIQGVIAAYGKKYLAGGDYDFCGYDKGSANRWQYPAGGTPTNYTMNVSEPVGAAISTKASH